MRVRDIYINITINGMRGGRSMVQAEEAQGRKGICTLTGLDDYDAACRRCDELGVPIAYSRANKPIVNVSLFREKSRAWALKQKKKK